MSAQQFSAFANIGAVTWTMSPTVGTLTSGGLYTAPASETTATQTVVTATSTTNGAVAASMTVVILPFTGNSIHISPGLWQSPGSGDYTDANGKVWNAGTNVGCDAQSSDFITNSGYGYWNGGSWPGTTDILLYKIPTFSRDNDLRCDFIVPNGNYSIDGKFAAIGNEGDFILNTQNTDSAIYDVYALVGANAPWDYNTTTTVTNNKLSFVLRVADDNGSGGAPFFSSLSLMQTGSGVPAAPAKLGVLLMAGTR
jgi:hypothetical protein